VKVSSAKETEDAMLTLKKSVVEAMVVDVTIAGPEDKLLHQYLMTCQEVIVLLQAAGTRTQELKS